MANLIYDTASYDTFINRFKQRLSNQEDIAFDHISPQ